MNQTEKVRPSFLKVEEGLQIGDYMPNITIPNQDMELYDCINDYLLLVTISTSCAPCLPAMEAIDIFIQQYPEINFLIFIETEESTFEKAKQVFHSSARIYHASDDVMFGELKTRGYPWAYGLNREGQIITIEPVASLEFLEKLFSPFRRFYNPKEES